MFISNGGVGECIVISCLSSVTQLYAGTGVKVSDVLNDVELAFTKAMEKKGM